MMVESFPYNITCWGAVVFEKWVLKQVTKITFVSLSVIASKNVLTSYMYGMLWFLHANMF